MEWVDPQKNLPLEQVRVIILLDTGIMHVAYLNFGLWYEDGKDHPISQYKDCNVIRFMRFEYFDNTLERLIKEG